MKPVYKAEGLVLAASQQVAAQEDTPGNPVVDGSHVTGYPGEELHYFEKDYCHSVVVGSKSYCSFVHSHNLQSLLSQRTRQSILTKLPVQFRLNHVQ